MKDTWAAKTWDSRKTNKSTISRLPRLKIGSMIPGAENHCLLDLTWFWHVKVSFRQTPQRLAKRRISGIKKYVFSINLLFQDFPFIIVKRIFIYLNLKAFALACWCAGDFREKQERNEAVSDRFSYVGVSWRNGRYVEGNFLSFYDTRQQNIVTLLYPV